MRHLLFTLTMLIGTVLVNAQTDSTKLILADPEVPAHFPGGMDSLLTLFEKNSNWEIIREVNTERTYVQFVVEEDGKVSNIEVMKGLNDTFNKEAERLIELLPSWQPGELYGKPRRTKMVLPISFGRVKFPFSGIYASNSQTLQFLEDNKCMLTIPSAWDGSKEQKFNWREINKNTIELTKLGFSKHTFQIEQHNGRTYLVNIKNLDNFRTNLLIIKQKPDIEANQTDYERYLLAMEKLDETLSK